MFIREKMVEDLVKNIIISKGSDMGLVSTCILKDSFEVCIVELTHLYNECLSKSSFSSSWGIGGITPIPELLAQNKKTENWRPVIQIKLSGKLLKCSVHTQIYNYLEVNNRQHGFRTEISTP